MLRAGTLCAVGAVLSGGRRPRDERELYDELNVHHYIKTID
jgi:hypothetical protein